MVVFCSAIFLVSMSKFLWCSLHRHCDCERRTNERSLATIHTQYIDQIFSKSNLLNCWWKWTIERERITHSLMVRAVEIEKSRYYVYIKHIIRFVSVGFLHSDTHIRINVCTQGNSLSHCVSVWNVHMLARVVEFGSRSFRFVRSIWLDLFVFCGIVFGCVGVWSQLELHTMLGICHSHSLPHTRTDEQHSKHSARQTTKRQRIYTFVYIYIGTIWIRTHKC